MDTFDGDHLRGRYSRFGPPHCLLSERGQLDPANSSLRGQPASYTQSCGRRPNGELSARRDSRQLGVQAVDGSAAWLGSEVSRRAGGLGVVAGPGGGVVVSGRGLALPRQLPFERWLAVGRRLSVVSSSAAWCLGDWLVYGQRAYEGRYRQAVEQTSLDYQTLRNYAWVAGRFALSRRRERLSFGHHAEVAALAEPEQDFWLRKAEEFGWPVKQLRRQVRASLAERAAGHGETATPGSASRDWVVVRLALRIPAGQLQACQEAADKASLSIEAWTIQALEHAARHQLDPT